MIQKATQNTEQTAKPSNTLLKEIQKQFENWRKTKQKREPIPEALWEAAVSVTQYNPIGRISKILQLDHRKLKKLVRARYGDNFLGCQHCIGKQS